MGACCSEFDDQHVVNIGLHVRLSLLLTPGDPYKLESTNYRGHFIRHRNGEFWIDADENHEGFN